MAASRDETYVPTQAPAAEAEAISVLSTDAVPPRQRAAYWHESVAAQT
jgi:hypothetical protein